MSCEEKSNIKLNFQSKIANLTCMKSLHNKFTMLLCTWCVCCLLFFHLVVAERTFAQLVVSRTKKKQQTQFVFARRIYDQKKEMKKPKKKHINKQQSQQIVHFIRGKWLISAQAYVFATWVHMYICVFDWGRHFPFGVFIVRKKSVLFATNSLFYPLQMARICMQNDVVISHYPF